MIGISIKVDRKELERDLGMLISHMEHRQEAMRKIGLVGVESIRMNFHVGGRPILWPALKRRRGQPLRDTNRLMNSIASQASNDGVIIGTNVAYAAVQNFGASKYSFGAHTFFVKAHNIKAHLRRSRGGKITEVRAHEVRKHSRTARLPWGTIPARKFMMFQDQDMLEFGDILSKYIFSERGPA